MEKQIEEIGQKKIELTKKYSTEIENIKYGLKLLEMDEIPDAVKKALMKEIEYSFGQKWISYKTAMDNLDAEMPKQYRQCGVEKKLIWI